MSEAQSTVSAIPEILFNVDTNTSYKRMQFFGRGSFAKCYEIVDIETNNIFASKVISKKLIMLNDQKKKMTQEIAIHRSLKHENVLKFLTFFEDTNFVYILLELCENRSMLELHKRRRTVTDYECRYFMSQLIQGVTYLHDNRIIHRDLKLGNLMLDDLLHVKIGDFGLATRIQYEGERKRALCGTPNYIAPEVLAKKGHSFEVDIWSIGCIMYTLLVGYPPFETRTLKGTYAKISKCEYQLPTFLQKSAAVMIMAMLRPNPLLRPKVNEFGKFLFLHGSQIPEFLPRSCLTMAPRLESKETYANCINAVESKPSAHDFADGVGDGVVFGIADEDPRLEFPFLKENLNDSFKSSAFYASNKKDYCIDLERLCQQLNELIDKRPKLLTHDLEIEHSDPAAQPLFWISKWVDYSDKYGFGYQLNDDSIGVTFNDDTKLVLLPNQHDVHYIHSDGRESYMTITNYCNSLKKKIRLLCYFENYMTNHLAKTATDNITSKRDCVSRVPHIFAWFRTTCGVCMFLSNGTVQMNFSDHMKLILCSRMNALTHIDKQKHFQTFDFKTIAENGCSKKLYEKLRYGCEKIFKFVDQLK